jgi:hypothetical protein
MVVVTVVAAFVIACCDDKSGAQQSVHKAADFNPLNESARFKT